jgi:hypothetical protein
VPPPPVSKGIAPTCTTLSPPGSGPSEGAQAVTTSKALSATANTVIQAAFRFTIILFIALTSFRITSLLTSYPKRKWRESQQYVKVNYLRSIKVQPEFCSFLYGGFPWLAKAFLTDQTREELLTRANTVLY